MKPYIQTLSMVKKASQVSKQTEHVSTNQREGHGLFPLKLNKEQTPG